MQFCEFILCFPLMKCIVITKWIIALRILVQYSLWLKNENHVYPVQIIFCCYKPSVMMREGSPLYMAKICDNVLNLGETLKITEFMVK